MLAQVIPFNNINPVNTYASILFRSYNSSDNGIRAGYGVSLGRDNDLLGMFISVDNDRRRDLSGAWSYFQGFGGSIKIASANFDRRSTIPVKEEYTLGLGWHWGVEYRFNEVFSLATEATLRFGVKLNDGGGFLKIDPPINIIAHFNLSN